MSKKCCKHFKGKEALGHVIEARQKGRDFMYKEHGGELSGPTFSFLDTAKECSVFFTVLAIVFTGFNQTISIPFFFAIFRASSTSIVSPLCVTAIIRDLSFKKCW